MKLVINTDGLSKGNPGIAAIGATLKDERGRIVATISQRIGITTNNVAEYKALIASVQKALKMGCNKVEILSDSELMVRQINGEYKVKSAGLMMLYLNVIKLLGQFDEMKIRHIPRELNAEADKLANDAV